MGIAYRILVGEPEGKRPRGRPGDRWEDNINIYQEIECGDVIWNHKAQGRI
jgi:hypothetical protein